jgi:hypothetical protein
MQSSDWKLTNYVFQYLDCDDSWNQLEKSVESGLFVAFSTLVLQLPLVAIMPRGSKSLNLSIPVILGVLTTIFSWIPFLCPLKKLLVYFASILTSILDILIFVLMDPSYRWGTFTVLILSAAVFFVTK